RAPARRGGAGRPPLRDQCDLPGAQRRPDTGDPERLASRPDPEDPRLGLRPARRYRPRPRSEPGRPGKPAPGPPPRSSIGAWGARLAAPRHAPTAVIARRPQAAVAIHREAGPAQAGRPAPRAASAWTAALPWGRSQ